MSKPRKHAELIKSWADGAEIQVEYRIKRNTLKYRLALYTGTVSDKPFVYVCEETMPRPTYAGGFVRWLTDWTEVDL